MKCFLWDTWSELTAPSQRIVTHSEESTICPLLRASAHRHPWLSSISVIEWGEGMANLPSTEHGQFYYLGLPDSENYCIVRIETHDLWKMGQTFLCCSTLGTMFVQLKPIWDVNVWLAGQVFLYGSSLLARNVVLWCIPPHYSIFKNFFFYDYHSFDKKKWLELEAGEYVGWSLWLYARGFLEECFNRLALSCAFLLQPYREPTLSLQTIWPSLSVRVLNIILSTIQLRRRPTGDGPLAHRHHLYHWWLT